MNVVATSQSKGCDGMDDRQPDTSEGCEAVHQELVELLLPIKCCIEHIVHPGRGVLVEQQQWEKNLVASKLWQDVSCSSSPFTDTMW